MFPAKYRKVVFDKGFDRVLSDICLKIECRYQMHFLEIGADDDHVHFLVRSVSMYSVTKLVTWVFVIFSRDTSM